MRATQAELVGELRRRSTRVSTRARTDRSIAATTGRDRAQTAGRRADQPHRDGRAGVRHQRPLARGRGADGRARREHPAPAQTAAGHPHAMGCRHAREPHELDPEDACDCDHGPVALDTPTRRDGTFQPNIVRECQPRSRSLSERRGAHVSRLRDESATRSPTMLAA